MSFKRKARGAVVSALLADRTQRVRRKIDSFRNRSHRLTFFHQPSDAHSHLLAQLVPELVDRFPFDLEIAMVPEPDRDANPEPERRMKWAARDARELTRYYQVDFPPGPEAPERSDLDLAERILLRERPVADQLAAIVTVGDALWSGDRRRLEECRSDLGSTDGHETDQRLEQNRALLRQRGHYMGGMLQYGTEWYWGLDRILHLESRLAAEGLGTPDSVVQRRDQTPSDPLQEQSGEIPLELYYSFRSPYSYLAIGRVLELAKKYPVNLKIRTVLPMVLRGLPVPRAKQIYIVLDAKREADRAGVPFGKVCDPLPGVERCMAIFPYAEREGRAGEFLESAGRGCWAEGLDLADDDDLRTVVERIGLDWSTATAAIADDAWKKTAADNRETLMALGLWGVPCFQLGDYTTWGQDRIWMVEDKIRRHLEANR